MTNDRTKTVTNIDQEDIVKYVKIYKSRRNWYNFKGDPTTPYFLIKKVYIYSRPFFFVLCFVITFMALAKKEDFGFLDGGILFLELWFHMMSMSLILWLSQANNEKLVKTINYSFKARDSLELREIRTGTLNKIYKIFKIGIKLATGGSFLIMILPMVLDTVMHYGFDMLDKPLTLPSPAESIIGPFKSWNAAYYFNLLFTLWFTWEVVGVNQTQVLGYVLLLVYTSIELRKFKLAVNALKREQRIPVIRVKLRLLFKWHQDFIQWKTDLKNYLGLPCAFNYLLTTVNLTLILFCAATGKNIVLKMGYTLGVVCYFLIGLLYCWLGQALENKSVAVYETIMYELPWYQYTPALRRDLLMLIRQAQYPVVIDYYGGSVMNLASFKDMISQTYSCFALLQTMTKEV